MTATFENSGDVFAAQAATPTTPPSPYADAALVESPSITQVTAALVAAKLEFAPAVKDAMNTHFGNKYATLDAVHAAVDMALQKNGIIALAQAYMMGTTRMLFVRLLHVSGEWLGSHLEIKPVKDDPQGVGSAITYNRRYGVMALCGIAPEDDDGNAASRAPQRDNRRQQTKPQKTSEPDPADYEDPTTYLAKLDAAKTAEELSAAGTDISAAELHPNDRTALRDRYRQRLQEFKGSKS